MPRIASTRRKFHGNQYTARSIQYSKNISSTVHGIVNLSIFKDLAKSVCCKVCFGKIRFEPNSEVGLGFKIKVVCDQCDELANHAASKMIGYSGRQNIYDLNVRSVLAMRLLGHGLRGIQTFCGVMDLAPPVHHSTYDQYVETILAASNLTCTASMRQAVAEEIDSSEAPDKLVVSGDGSWRRRGFSSLYGIVTLMGNESGKVLDVVVKSSYCQACKNWGNRDRESAEYQEWEVNHARDCKRNHHGSAGKMEPDGLIEMFVRSVDKYGVKYSVYVGDGDSKSYKQLVERDPYGRNIMKKECVGHVGKRMGSQLRELKNKLGSTKLSDGKTIGGLGRLGPKLIDTLTSYYGKAIRDNNDSLESMRNAIWAIFYHESSSDQSSNHSYCPKGINSWCKYNKAIANGTIGSFRHKPTPPPCVWERIKAVFDNLTREDLLIRCLGGYNQNNNESLNSKVWKIAPKALFSQLETLKIAVNIAVSTWNDGGASIDNLMNHLNLDVGQNCRLFLSNMDEKRQINSEFPRDGPCNDVSDQDDSDDDLNYGPGIAD